MERHTVEMLITSSLKKGGKTPGMFQVPKALTLKSALEACTNQSQVVHQLASNAEFICKEFGVTATDLEILKQKIAAM